MLIDVPVDVGYAFDMLSILEVKRDVNKKNDIADKLIENVTRLKERIKDGIGDKLFNSIYKSQAYMSLYLVNVELFDKIDLAKHIDIPSKEIDDLNYKRYLHKKQIHEVFFNGEISEVKIGY